MIDIGRYIIYVTSQNFLTIFSANFFFLGKFTKKEAASLRERSLENLFYLFRAAGGRLFWALSLKKGLPGLFAPLLAGTQQEIDLHGQGKRDGET